VARASFFEDEDEESSALATQSRDVATMFMRVANSIRAMNDERGSLPDISETDPQRLYFSCRRRWRIEVEMKQELLELRLTSERLSRLRDLLARVVGNYEERARIHSIANATATAARRSRSSKVSTTCGSGWLVRAMATDNSHITVHILLRSRRVRDR